MLMACMRGTCSKNLTQKHETKKQSIKQNPNSNNLAYLQTSNKRKTKLSKHVITQTKQEKQIKQQKKEKREKKG